MTGAEIPPGDESSLTVVFPELTSDTRELVLAAVHGLRASGIMAQILEPEGPEPAQTSTSQLYSSHATLDGGNVSIVQRTHIFRYDPSADFRMRRTIGPALFAACYDRRLLSRSSSEKIPAVMADELANPRELLSPAGPVAGMEIPVFFDTVDSIVTRQRKIQNIGISATRYLRSYSEALRQELDITD